MKSNPTIIIRRINFCLTHFCHGCQCLPSKSIEKARAISIAQNAFGCRFFGRAARNPQQSYVLLVYSLTIILYNDFIFVYYDFYQHCICIHAIFYQFLSNQIAVMDILLGFYVFCFFCLQLLNHGINAGKNL
eukprot:Pompholyxophrys_punicea_v1_NODE_292_length_2357_cov_3.146829.p2 type:complete len:132 gc:universal NODE_292_length_2357_cov_3.146829:1301-906(-)